MIGSSFDISVLYVEDDDASHVIVKRLIEKYVSDYHTAMDGEEGYDAYLKYRPDLVITDVEMPKISGVRLTALIKEHDQSQLVAVLTAFEDELHFADQADFKLVKPIDKDVMLEVLRETAERKKRKTG
jgi:YesN/AraC family two-component response regulator